MTKKQIRKARKLAVRVMVEQENWQARKELWKRLPELDGIIHGEKTVEVVVFVTTTPKAIRRKYRRVGWCPTLKGIRRVQNAKMRKLLS